MTSGGTIPDGTYLLSGWWNCTGGYNKIFGATTIEHDASGRMSMRYGRIFAADNAANSETKGTYLLEPNVGSITRTEECRAGFVGTSDTGTFLYAADTLKLTFRFADHDEEWTRQL